MPQPWSSQLAADVRRERSRLLVTFVELRATLRQVDTSAFAEGEMERSRLLRETETDYVALVAASADGINLERRLEAADREATQREVDAAAVMLEQLRELVRALRHRLP